MLIIVFNKQVYSKNYVVSSNFACKAPKNKYQLINVLYLKCLF